jgi:hypothetical protein
MGRIGLALRVFWGTLTGSLPASRVKALLSESDGPATTAVASPPSSADPPGPKARAGAPPGPRRNDAITLMAALQREARFVDLVQESLEQYSDEQIGAAARDVLRDCREVLSRMFELQPVVPGEENDMVDAPAPLIAGRLRVTGNVAGQPPFRGRLIHHGWEAARCDLPNWSGDEQSVRVIAPAEIEC